MIATIYPSHCSGSVHIPPSKSMAHRAIICAALADGVSHLTNIDFSDDILATIDGMRQLGANIETSSNSVTVHGIRSFAQLQSNVIDCKESGSTLRFFIPIFSLCDQKIHFTGKGRLMRRPQDVYEELFARQSLQFMHDEEGITIAGKLKPGEYEIDGGISSQFITGLLFTLPLLEADSLIHIRPPFESRSYIDLTLEMLEKFGIRAYFEDALTLRIPGRQHYHPHDVRIEGDYSQLAFFAVLAAIQGDLAIHGVSGSSAQGDRQILSILQDFGAAVQPLEDGFLIHQGKLRAAPIDLNDCPDLGPVLFVLAAMAEGTTHICHAGRLRIKESDRIAAMEEELRRFGVQITSDEDNVWIQGTPQGYVCHEVLHSHNDHRVVMALSVMALCSHSVCTIADAEAIRKSYPSFFSDVAAIHGKVEYR